MKSKNRLSAVVISAALALSVTTQAKVENGEAVDMKSLPAAVQKAIKDTAGTSEIIRVQKEDDPNGKWNYEVVAKTGGKQWAFEVDPSGKVLRKHS